MNLKSFSYSLWYAIWFVILPGVLSWTLISTLDRTGVIEELEIWYVLIAFALFSYVTYSIRYKLPFWQDTDENSPKNQSNRKKEATLLVKSVRQKLKKNKKRITQKGQKDLNDTILFLDKAIQSNDDRKIIQGTGKLMERVLRHLKFAQKSAAREYLESIGVAVLIAVILRLFVIEAFKIPSESMVPTLMVGDHIFVSKYLYGLSLPFTNKRLVRFKKPAHGDVIVFIKPPVIVNSVDPMLNFASYGEDKMAGTDFIKRVVGVEGDVLSMKDDILFKNNKKVPRCKIGLRTYRSRNLFSKEEWEDEEDVMWVEKLGDQMYTIIDGPGGSLSNFGPVKVPPDHVFVMGDNRDNSNDSRAWGFVPFDNIKGRAMFIWWSNRRPHGFQWNRIGNMIMSGPSLTKEQEKTLLQCKNMF